MRLALCPFKNAKKDLLFWIAKFVRYKINTLSNHQVNNKQIILQSLNALNSDNLSMEQIIYICKQVRKAGLIGINVFIVPLERLYTYVSELGLDSIKSIDEHTLIDFISIYTSSLSDASKKNYRIALIGLFGFIDKNNEYEHSQYIFNINLSIAHLKSSAVSSKLPTYLNENELRRFLQALDTTPQDKSHQVRDKLIIKIIIYTGMRVSEALNLRIKDIISKDSFWIFQLRGKGNKMRTSMIKGGKIENLMSLWLDTRAQIKSIHDIEGELIFCNNKGKKLTQARIYQSLSNILITSGIKKDKMGAHMLRHTFATMLYSKKHDLVLVQEALGHASLNTSRIYTHFDKSRLMEAANIIDEFEKGS